MADTGVISGTASLTSQINSMVQQYQQSLTAQKVTPLQTQKTALNARLVALNNLKPLMQALYNTSDAMTKTGADSQFLAYSVGSSLQNVVTATASSAASLGSHAMFVSQLAKADMAMSDQIMGTSTSIVTAEGAGVKTIQVGNKSVNLTLVDGDTNSAVIAKITSAINLAGGNVTASNIADTLTTNRLVLASTGTGSTNALALSDTAGTLLARLGLDSATISSRTVSNATNAGFSYSSVASLDSKFNLDGIDFTRQANTVNDVLSGVTFTLNAVQSNGDTPASLTVGVNQGQIINTVQNFLGQYNSLMTNVKNYTAVDPANNIRQVLAGDSTFTMIKVNLQAAVNHKVTGVQLGNPDILYKIGITAAADGTLSITDTSKFNAAIAADTKKVSDLFNASDGIAVQMKTMMNGFVKTKGRMDTATTSLTNQVSSIASKIKDMNLRIAKQVVAYQDDFARLQSAYQDAVNQQTSINTIMTYYTSTTG